MYIHKYTCASMHVCILIHTHTSVYGHAQADTHACRNAHAHADTHPYTHVHKHEHTHAHTHMLSYTHVSIYLHMHTHTHAHTQNKPMLEVIMPTKWCTGPPVYYLCEFFNFPGNRRTLYGNFTMPHKSVHLNYHLHLTHRWRRQPKFGGGQIC